jgi:hypothetical protein
MLEQSDWKEIKIKFTGRILTERDSETRDRERVNNNPLSSKSSNIQSEHSRVTQLNQQAEQHGQSLEDHVHDILVKEYDLPSEAVWVEADIKFRSGSVLFEGALLIALNYVGNLALDAAKDTFEKEFNGLISEGIRTALTSTIGFARAVLVQTRPQFGRAAALTSPTNSTVTASSVSAQNRQVSIQNQGLDFTRILPIISLAWLILLTLYLVIQQYDIQITPKP